MEGVTAAQINIPVLTMDVTTVWNVKRLNCNDTPHLHGPSFSSLFGFHNLQLYSAWLQTYCAAFPAATDTVGN